MSYEEAVQQLYALSGELAPAQPGAPRRKFELEHMRVLAAAFGDPQKQFPCVLVAGTNGKGSTAATLASILSMCGYRTGLYTSPHLMRVNERIQMTSDPAQPGANTLHVIDDESFTARFRQVDEVGHKLVEQGRLPNLPSFFEVVTMMAFLAFAQAKLDIAVLEVGLGGRLDATNIVDSLVSVITDIALDHTEWLGDTLGAIAREKAGILRPHGTMVTLPQHPEANTAIGEIAMALQVDAVSAADYLPERGAPQDGYPVQVFGSEVLLQPVLPGEHQRRNTALAVAAAVQLREKFGFERITPSAIATGVRQTRWPGRLETVTGPGGSTVLLDVAHNPAGMWTLRSYLSGAFATALPGPRTLVFSALRDKAVKEMAQILFPLFDEPGDRILLAPVNSPRAAGREELAAIARELETDATVCASVSEAMQMAADRVGGCIVISGSVYLVGEAKTWLEQVEA